jgi:hypothetical protein
MVLLMVQRDVQTRAADSRQALHKFTQHIITLLVEAFKVHISDLDSHLIGVRDGMVSEEAALQRQKIGRFVLCYYYYYFCCTLITVCILNTRGCLFLSAAFAVHLFCGYLACHLLLAAPQDCMLQSSNYTDACMILCGSFMAYR